MARALALFGTVGLLLAGCGPSVEPSSGSGGSGGGAVSSTGGTPAPSSTSISSGGDGGAGGVACEPYDQECNCADCDGTCLMRCNFGAGYECFEPPAPTSQQFSCGGFVNCDVATQACIHVEPQGDGCIDYFCADLPATCRNDASCECVVPFVDEHDFGFECSDVDNLEVTLYGDAQNPPWDSPWCGDATCAGAESCYRCVSDGGMGDPYFECDLEDPSVPGIQGCSVQWYAPPQEG